MKKFLLMVVAVLGLSMTTAMGANAEGLDYEALIYGEPGDKEMYLISKTTFFVNYSNGKLKDLDYSHMELGNGKVYNKTQFFIAISQEFAKGNNYASAMNALNAKADKKLNNVFVGKVANDGTIINKAATDTTIKPERFEVISIQ